MEIRSSKSSMIILPLVFLTFLRISSFIVLAAVIIRLLLAVMSPEKFLLLVSSEFRRAPLHNSHPHYTLVSQIANEPLYCFPSNTRYQLKSSIKIKASRSEMRLIHLKQASHTFLCTEEEVFSRHPPGDLS